MTAATFEASHDRPTQLVGRRLELSWLRTRLGLVQRGFAHLVLLEGEAGIGKTRLAHEFLAEARRVGFTTVRGRCYQHFDLAYLPLRDSLFTTLSESLSGQSGNEEEVELLLRVGSGRDADQARACDPDDRDRTRQLLMLTRLVIDYARRSATVISIDDVDWADHATLDFLRHLLFRLDDQEVPLLLLATSRGDPHARGADGVAQLRSDARCATILLHPLSELEATQVARGLRAGASIEQARELAIAGGGIPLLVEALSRESASVHPEADALGGAARGHPLLTAIYARLDALGEDARSVVERAAFLVPHCTRAVLAAVTRLEEDRLGRALEEAIAEGVLVEDQAAIMFTHPLYAHMVYDATPVPKRRQAHARIAAVLLASRDSSEPIALRSIAYHLVGAGREADPGIVVDLATRAGDEAMGLAAWSEAARYYEAALEAIDAHADPVAAASLHRRAGLCARFDLEIARAVSHFDEAIRLCSPLGDAQALVLLHQWRIRCALALESQGSPGVVIERESLEHLVGELETQSPALAAEGLAELAQSYWVEGDMPRADKAAHRSMELAGSTANHLAFAQATTALCVAQWSRYDLRESLATLEQGVDHARQASDESALAGGPLFRVPLVLTWLGRFDEAEQRALACRAAAAEVNYPLEEGLPLSALAQLAVARGDFDRADYYAHEALLIQRLSGYHWAAPLFSSAVVSACVARGRYEAAHDSLERWAELASPFEQSTIALFHRYVTALERELPIEGADPLASLPRVPMLGIDDWAAANVETARREGRELDLPQAHDLLEEMERRGGVVTSGLVVLIPRVLGVAADLLGNEDEAINALGRAISVSGAIGAEPEHARALVDLAIIRMRRSERDLAYELVGTAVEEFERLGMTPELARADQLTGSATTRAAPTRANGPSARQERLTSATSVILFTDVVESTRLTEELGNLRYRERARQLEGLITSTIVVNGGSYVTGISLGDGFIGLFPSIEGAITAGRLCARNAGSTGLHLHLAIHRGELIIDGPRIFGGAVNLAARICDLTGPDEILVSETIRSSVVANDVAFVDRGEHALKGIEEPQRLYALVDADPVTREPRDIR